MDDQNPGISLKLSDKARSQGMERASPSEKVLEVSWNTCTSNLGAFGQKVFVQRNIGVHGEVGAQGHVGEHAPRIRLGAGRRSRARSQGVRTRCGICT